MSADGVVTLVSDRQILQDGDSATVVELPFIVAAC